MRVDKPAFNRTVGERPRFVAYVVEGEKNDNPGMVRAIRFDKDGGGSHWLECTWTNNVDDMGVVKPRSRLAAYRVHPDQEARGAFLLKDEYERIGRSDLYEEYDRYERSHESGQYWPDSLLPPKVLQLRKLQTKREAQTWALPDSVKPLSADDADEDDDAPSLAANLDKVGPAPVKARTSGRKA